jgi:secondary thiamine-phosphate synthase enzyme
MLICRHTSASLIVREKASPEVRLDLQEFVEALAPDPLRQGHQEEAADDRPARPRSALTGVSLAIPLMEGAPATGTWRGLFLFERRRAPPSRQIALNLLFQSVRLSPPASG